MEKLVLYPNTPGRVILTEGSGPIEFPKTRTGPRSDLEKFGTDWATQWPSDIVMLVS